MAKWKDAIQERLITAWEQLPLPGWLRTAFLWTVLPKFLVGAVAVIFDKQGRILLFRHTYRSEYPWGLPGGWLKRGEHAHEAIEREILEESGYQVHALRSVVIGGDRKLHRLDLYFECELINGTFLPSAEVCDAAFFDLDHLPDCLEPFNRQVINYTVCRPERSICRDEKT